MRMVKYLIAFPIELLGIIIVTTTVFYRRYLRGGNAPPKKPRLVWGPTPLLNYKYFANALKQKGYLAKTLVDPPYHISEKGDFDVYIERLLPEFRGFWFFKAVRDRLLLYLSFAYAVRHFDIFHHNCHGGFLGRSIFWKWEAWLLRKAGCKVVIGTYGADIQRYSRIVDPCFRHVLQTDYPNNARREPEIARRVEYWVRNADVFFSGSSIDGIGRWDYIVPSTLCIDLSLWSRKRAYSKNDGFNGPVKVIHTPNHRGIKGTEFIIEAVNELRSDGLDIQLILLEKKKNTEVCRLMQEEADILAEQLLATAYGLSAIEGMASGIPVLANLESGPTTRIFRRYSFLNECPILSTTPETVKDNLLILANNPDLREELGRAGREYVEKYHSYETAQFVFEAFYDRIWYGKEVDAMNLFHPLKSEYVKSKPLVKHPLVENKLAEPYRRTAQSNSRN